MAIILVFLTGIYIIYNAIINKLKIQRNVNKLNKYYYYY
jgi:hypothetical protein